MATELRLRRGTTDEHSNFIGAEAEATVDTDKNTIVVHDGQTQGGAPLAQESDTAPAVDSVSSLRTSSFSENLERLYLSGYYGVGTPGGGELFRSSGTDDGGQFFQDNDGNIWERNEQLITPAQFGAQSQNDSRHEAWKTWVTGKFNSLDSFFALTSDRVVSVPSDYTTLQEALNNEKHWIPNGQRINIELEDGYELAEPVELRDEVLPHIRITKPDGSDMNLDAGFSGGNVFKFENCWAPTIGFRTNCSGLNTDAAIRYIASRGVIQAGAGAINSGWRGLYVTTASVVDAQETIWDGAADDGIRVSNAGFLQIRAASSQNCGNDGLSAAGASTTNASGSPNFSGATNNGILADNGANIYTFEPDCTNCISNGINARQTARVDAQGVDTRGCGSNGLLAETGATITTDGATISDQANPSNGVRAVAGTITCTNSIIDYSSGRGATGQQKGSLNLQGTSVNNSTNNDLVIFHGSTINISSGTYNTASHTENTLHPEGIIFND